ncbi:hypothetical protein CK203_017901 [Vitis vinifera]|uniref:Uncharacterized protein n=1 Tax=Vitis vinifera TaxID=29760 RepID=A0A438JVW6_VITVI|nr:hypothetical protein CK203_017901 [Vitis vinifera]
MSQIFLSFQPQTSPAKAPVQGPPLNLCGQKLLPLRRSPHQNPPARSYLTRSGGRPLQKKARVESSEPIDLTEQSSVPSPKPSLAPSSVPPSRCRQSLWRPMLTQPPIEGNLGIRMEHLLTPRDFFYPRVAMDFYQSMTRARHIAEALHIPYEPSHFEDYRVWTSPSQLEMVHILSREAFHKSTSIEGGTSSASMFGIIHCSIGLRGEEFF